MTVIVSSSRFTVASDDTTEFAVAEVDVVGAGSSVDGAAVVVVATRDFVDGDSLVVGDCGKAIVEVFEIVSFVVVVDFVVVVVVVVVGCVVVITLVVFVVVGDAVVVVVVVVVVGVVVELVVEVVVATVDEPGIVFVMPGPTHDA